MKVIRTVAPYLAFILLLAQGVRAEEDIASFENVRGWRSGQSSNRQYAHDLVVSLETRRSSTPGKMNVIAEFCNNGSKTWVGGIRLSPTRPTRSHSSMTVPQGSCREWSEIMEEGVTRIYVYARANK